MRVIRKTISVLALTPEEVAVMMNMIAEAEKGHVAHYSERETRPGVFFGVSVGARNEEEPRKERKEPMSMGVKQANAKDAWDAA